MNPSWAETIPYDIRCQVGEGTMGTVYEAVDRQLGRVVALKLLNHRLLTDHGEDFANEMRRRFTQEARAAAALSHPSLTTIYQVGSAGETPYIAMEWLDGQTLESLLDSERRLSPTRAVLLTIQLLGALEVAHRGNVVHRDIKPANLMVLPGDRVKVMDFGVAHVRGSDLVQTQVGSMFGTPRFAAPEQFLFEAVDSRSDLFSVGVVLFNLLTGEFPFRGNDVAEVGREVLAGAQIGLRQLDPSIPEELEAIVVRAIQRDKNQRWQTAEEMSAALENYVATVEGYLTRSPLVSTPDPIPGSGRRSAVVAGLRPTALGVIGGVLVNYREKRLPLTSGKELLSRLMERPIHAAPFSGAVAFGTALVLFYEGLIVGAAQKGSAATMDVILDSLSRASFNEVRLFTADTDRDRQLIPLLAVLLSEKNYLHQELDSSFVNLPALAEKLAADRFTGALEFRRGQDVAYVFVDRGETLLTTYSEGFNPAETSADWRGWIGTQQLKANVIRGTLNLAARSYQAVNRNAVLDASVGKKSVELKFQGERPEGIGSAFGEFHRRDPSYGLALWMLNGLRASVVERVRAREWKYLLDWLKLVERVRLHHDLPRPEAVGSDHFDVVTSDSEGKVLHVAERVVAGDEQHFEEFFEKVVRAKSARRETGDIGGAILVAPRFEAATFDAYFRKLSRETGGSLLDGLFTNYSGFVRLSSRRGFHLLLVEERGGQLVPLPKWTNDRPA